MTNRKTIIDIELVWKKINQTISEEEDQLLEQWLNESPDHQKYMTQATKFFLHGSGFPEGNEATVKGWSIVKSGIKVKNRLYAGWIISLSAAVVAIFLILHTLLPTKTNETNPLAPVLAGLIGPGSNQAVLIMDDGTVHDLASTKNLVLKEGNSEIKREGSKLQYTAKEGEKSKVLKYNTLSIPRGGEFFLQLSDGTKVWLNSETVLRYPVQFDESERRVELIGEAYFEVTKNGKAPFFVKSGEQTVKVLGTEFNISSYKESPIIYTTLIKGSVEVLVNNKPNAKQVLKPNEQSSITRADGLITKSMVDTYEFMAWKDGRLVFQNQNLEIIMNTLMKWYDVEVVFSRDDLRQIRFTGDLPRYSKLGEVLSKIQKTNEVKFLIENRRVTIE
ncbi:MAG: FecR domain-containing protein [Verrucomicrobiota bacterium]